MTKKRKGQDPDAGDEDGEQSRTPIRSELDKQEGLFLVGVLTAVLIPVRVNQNPVKKKNKTNVCHHPSRKGADSSAGSFESAHQAASEVGHPSRNCYQCAFVAV